MTLLAGIDAGGSHTEAAVSHEDLVPLARSRGAPGNVAVGDGAAAVTAIQRTLEAAMRDARTTSVDAIVVGCAGAGSEEARTDLEEAIRIQHVPSVVRVVTDADIALASAFGGAPGILLSAGTGSIACARHSDGTVHRVGGHGWRFGDEGGGYYIAAEAIRAAIRAHEGRGQSTSLWDNLDAAVREQHGLSLLRWLRLADVRDVTTLLSCVTDTAGAGDQVAETILVQAVHDLVGLVEALRVGYASESSVRVALNGGLLHPDSPLHDRIVADLRDRVPNVDVVAGPVDPVIGALRLAAALV
jgi:N-acetylglucosamine kinase-like BadF-type ATPase